MAKKKGEVVTKKKKVIFVIAKGNPDVEGNAVKMNALNVVIKFMNKILPEMKVLSDKNNILVVMQNDEPGNPEWLKTNVFRFVDVLGTTDDIGADERAEKAAERYMTANTEGSEMVGYGILRYYLQQFYLFERSASMFEVEE